MIYVEKNQKDEVTLIHHLPFDPVYGLKKSEHELQTTGALVEELPQEESVEGKVGLLKYNAIDNTCYYEYYDKPLTLDEKIEFLEKENAQIRLDSAQSNTELFEMMLAMSGGIA